MEKKGNGSVQCFTQREEFTEEKVREAHNPSNWEVEPGRSLGSLVSQPSLHHEFQTIKPYKFQVGGEKPKDSLKNKTQIR